MSNEVWDVVRMVNITMLLATFVIMIYKGVLGAILTRRIDYDRILNLCWVLVTMFAITELLYQHAGWGLRIILQTVVITFQLYVVIFKFNPKEEVVYK